jgi:hypothetical protein
MGQRSAQERLGELQQQLARLSSRAVRPRAPHGPSPASDAALLTRLPQHSGPCLAAHGGQLLGTLICLLEHSF